MNEFIKLSSLKGLTGSGRLGVIGGKNRYFSTQLTQKYNGAQNDRFDDIETDQKKEVMDKCIYFDEKPLNYHNYFSCLDYGANHDGLIKLLSQINDDIKSILQNAKYTDIGSSYGSTTLAVIDNMTWNQVGDFWKNEDLKIKNVNNINVTAFDISKYALSYGQKRDYFHNIINDDFNNVSCLNENKIKNILRDSDILSIIGCSTYLKNSQDFLKTFLNPKSRDKEKMLLYECIHSFSPDRINNMGPNQLFKNHDKWDYETLFCKHRNFTQQERIDNFDGNHESWMHYFAVKFDKL